MSVKERFSNTKTAKSVKTVGELIAELGRLPANTRVKSDMSLWITPKRRKKIKARAKRQGLSVSEAIGRLIDGAED